jgi:hypothetical protein
MGNDKNMMSQCFVVAMGFWLCWMSLGAPKKTFYRRCWSFTN